MNHNFYGPSEALFAVLSTLGYVPYSYSGRFMYGRSCIGVPVEGGQRDIVKLVIQVIKQLDEWVFDSTITEEERDEVELLIMETRTDSMGMDTVAYFPESEWDNSWVPEIPEAED